MPLCVMSLLRTRHVAVLGGVFLDVRSGVLRIVVEDMPYFGAEFLKHIPAGVGADVQAEGHGRTSGGAVAFGQIGVRKTGRGGTAQDRGRVESPAAMIGAAD